MQKYPMEVYSSIKQTKNCTKTLSLEAALGCDELKPLNHAGWSRIRATLIDKFADHKVINIANIPAREVAAIYDMATFAISAAKMEKALRATSAPTSPESGATALKTALMASPKMGSNKGKPYYTLGPKVLAAHRDFLKKNVSKFPSNQEEIDKINFILSSKPDDVKQAIEEINSGAGTAVASDVKTIYDSGIKPLVSRQDSEGRSLIYRIVVTFDVEKRYPFEVAIENCYAPVRKTDKGALNVVMGEAVNKATVRFSLSELEGMACLNAMKTTVGKFEAAAFPMQYRLAKKIEDDAIASYKSENKTDN